MLNTPAVLVYTRGGSAQKVVCAATLREKIQDIGPTSPNADPIAPGAWQGSHRSTNLGEGEWWVAWGGGGI